MKDYQGAHSVTQRAIKSGALERRPCSRCGAAKAEAHHDDYSKPLDVIWFCRKCHKTRHAELRRGLADGMEINDLRIGLGTSRDMTNAIDAYWRQERLRSRPDAIRELLAYALDAKLGTAKPAKGSENRP